MASAGGRRWRALPALVVLCAAAAAVGGCSSPGGGATAAKSRLQGDYVAVVSKFLSSVVEIRAGSTEGSGVVYDTRGDIVTNAHVVGASKKFEVRASALSTPLRARLIGEFAPDDLAVIRVLSHAKSLRPVRWADSAKVQAGQIVLAMGSPYGLIDSVTQGIVSATGRLVTGPAVKGQPPAVISDAIQTSAAINPGNSGGALVLLSGYVLGIPTLTAKDPQLGTAAEGIGFAIPANTVRAIASQLIKTGRVTKSDRASLDFTGRTHTSPLGKPDGVTVDAVWPGGSAAGAGIAVGEVIVGVGGKQTLNLNQLDSVLIDFAPGRRVSVEILRDGNPHQVTAKLGSLRS